MKKILFLLLIMAALVLAGCRGAPAPSEGRVLTATPIVKPTNTPSPTAIASITPSPTPSLPAPSPTAAGTPTIPPGARFKTQCPEIKSSLPADAALRGTIVLVYPYRFDQWTEERQVYLWDIETGEKRLIGSKDYGISDIAISFDRKWLAYTQGKGQFFLEDKSLVVAAADGQARVKVPWEEGWGRLAYWLNNQNLIIRRSSDVYDETFTPLLTLNPFTGERRKLPPDPEDIFCLSPIPDWRGMGMISYDPKITRRVYPNCGYELVLEDLEAHEVLTQFLVPIYEAVPLWAPDGQSFAITKVGKYDWGPIDYELYSVNLDGQITRLTFLTRYYPKTYISDYAWSPDGQYIAFWVETEKEKTYPLSYLAVLDMGNQDVTLYCIETTSTGAGGGTNPGLPPLIWSPDSRQLITGIYSKLSEGQTSMIVLDLVDGWVVELAEEMTPIGWMKADE